MPALEKRIRKEAAVAKRDSSLLAGFKALRLNMGTSDTEQSTLLDAGTWRGSRRDGAPLLERARLVGTISGVLDVVLALAELECVGEASEMTACVVDASFLGVAHPVLDLGVVSPGAV